jgi:hypothetical protein
LKKVGSLVHKQGVCHTVALPFTLKSILSLSKQGEQTGGIWTATEAEQAFGLRPEAGHL